VLRGLPDLDSHLLDTAGLEEVTDDSWQGRIARLTETALSIWHCRLFMIDARVGVTPSVVVFADIPA